MGTRGRLLTLVLAWRQTWICLLWLGIMSAPAYASQPLSWLPVTERVSQLNTAPYVMFLEDDQRQIQVEDFQAEGAEILLSRLQHYPELNQHFNFGTSTSDFWLRLPLRNQTSSTQNLVLQFANPILDYAEVYLSDGLSSQRLLLGNELPFNQREVQTHGHIILFPLSAKAELIIWIKARAEHSSSFPLQLYQETDYYQELFQTQVFNGIAIGIMLGLLAYNSFVFFSTRESSYFYYILLALMTILTTAVRNNYLYSLWPEAASWNRILYPSLPMLGVIALSQFTRSYMDTPKFYPLIDKLLKAYMVYTAIFAYLLCQKINMFVFYILYLPVSLVVAIAMVSLGVDAWRRGYLPARAYLIGLFMPIVAGAIITAQLLGYVPTGRLMEISLYHADLLQLVVFSLGLAQKVNLLLIERAASEKRALQASADNESKSQFLAQMSHEIRTPLNGIMGTTDLLNDTEMNLDQLQYVTTIRNSSQSLLTIINDILDFSSLEDGKLKLESGDFELLSMLQDCVDMFCLEASRKGLQYSCCVAPDVPCVIHADAARLRQVILNLLGNAFKFTQQGEVRIEVTVMGGGGAEVVLRIAVTDTGIGIPADAQAGLFEQFSQVDASTSRKYGGSGLGLTISQQLVRSMGGDIGVHSREGLGSTFWFHLPVQRLPQRDPVPKASLRGKRVLLADQQRSYYRALGWCAERWGMGLQYVQTVDELLDLLQQNSRPVDLLLLEHHFLDAMSAKQRDLWKPLAAAIPHAYLVELGQGEGAQGVAGRPYLVKQPYPYRMYETLIAMLNNPVRPHAAARQRQQPWRQFAGRLLVAEDNPVNRQVIKGLLKKLGLSDITLVTDGLAAWDHYCQERGGFDLVLMDCEMPNLDGFGATERIRRFELDQSLRATPIVAVSAHALAEHRDRSRQVGMDEHLPKPISAKALEDVLTRYLSERVGE